ncbi:MAG: hypothetical protein ACKOPP_06955 [Bacteroidota bacterium]
MGVESQVGRWAKRTSQVLDFLGIWERKSGDKPQDLPGLMREIARKNPQMGSKDRKEWSDGIYQALRARRYLVTEPWETCLAEGLASRYGVDHPWVQSLLSSKPETERPLDAFERLGHTGFPGADQVSSRLDSERFFRAQAQTGHAWVRVPTDRWSDFTKQVLERSWPSPKVQDSPFSSMFVTASLPLGLPLHTLPAYDAGWMDIQDWSSQALAEHMPTNPKGRWLDACAGSGGKTLLMHHAYPALQWFVTDVREFVLQELSRRFQRIGWKNYSRAVVDWTQDLPPDLGSFPDRFDGILLDAPCSGSGSWRNQPQAQLRPPVPLEPYILQQSTLLRKLWGRLQSGGYLVYATCSVYAAENENLIHGFLQNNPDAHLEGESYLDGSPVGGDVLFTARLRKA